MHIFIDNATQGARVTHELRERQEIGWRIKQLRIAKGQTIKGLAQHANMSAGYLSEVERGRSALSAEKLAALARCFGSTVDYLLSGGANANPTSGDMRIPIGLAQAAEALDLSYVQTTRLLAAKRSLVAGRGQDQEEWTETDWTRFYSKVKRYL